jgi:CheY-like chemotaxis protein
LRGAHILLVEDNDMNREFALEILGRAGVQVDVAGNGQEALEKIDCFHYDGVLMDCQMPVMDGFEATRRLRADGRFDTLPVIAMTANAMAGDRERCAAAGMDDHIAKPIDIDQMFVTLARWVRPRNGTDVAIAKPDVPQAVPLPQVADLDIAKVMDRIGEDGHLFRNMLRWFADGQASFAQDIRAAIAADDYALAHRLAHTLKGAAADIGATRLSEAARRPCWHLVPRHRPLCWMLWRPYWSNNSTTSGKQSPHWRVRQRRRALRLTTRNCPPCCARWRHCCATTMRRHWICLRP